MTVRELVAKLGLKIDQPSFEQGERRIQQLKTAAAALGSLWAGSRIVSAVKAMTQETAALGDGLNVLSARSGMSIEAIQELRYAGEAAGVAVGQVDAAIFRLSRRMGAAAQGNKAMADAFARAGVAIRDSSGRVRNAEDVMMDLADRMAAMSSESERASVGMALMGDTGIAMAAALKGGSAEVARLRQEARELGLVEAELAVESSKLVMNQQRLRYAIQWVKNTISGALIPWLNETIKGWLEWLRVNRELVKMRLEQVVRGIAAALQSVGRVLSALARMARFAYDTMGRLGQVMTWVLGVATALLVVLGLQKTLALLTVAALWLLMDDFIVWLRGGESVIGEAIKAIKRLTEEFLMAEYTWQEHPILKTLQEAIKLAKELAGILPKPAHRREGYWQDPPGHKHGAKPKLGDPGAPIPYDPTLPVEEHGVPLLDEALGKTTTAFLAPAGATIHQTNEINITVPPGAEPGRIREEVLEGIEAANQGVLRLLPGVLA